MTKDTEHELRKLKKKFLEEEISLDEYKKEEKRLLDEADKCNDEICSSKYVEESNHKQKTTMGYAEKNMLILAAMAFVVLFAVEAMFYFAFVNPASVTYRYWHYVFYLVISTVFMGAAVWHVKHYRHMFNCSMGMMVGMTVGMMAGFMIGAIIGASNGMFTGSVIGVLTGMVIGAWCTRRCGVMSVLEGMMAGLMAGLMGAMTTVMLINDNVFLFMPLLIGSCSLILGGMSYMVYKETTEQKEKIAKLDKYDMVIYLSAMFIFTIFITAIIVWGPKSVLVAGL